MGIEEIQVGMIDKLPGATDDLFFVVQEEGDR